MTSSNQLVETSIRGRRSGGGGDVRGRGSGRQSCERTAAAASALSVCRKPAMICMSARRRRAGTLNNARRGLLVVLVVVFETQRLSTLRPLAYIKAQGGVGDDFHPFPARKKERKHLFSSAFKQQGSVFRSSFCHRTLR